jgi:hypothetical protein
MDTGCSVPLIKRPEREADYPPPYSAETKNEMIYPLPLPVCHPGGVELFSTMQSTISAGKINNTYNWN